MTLTVELDLDMVQPYIRDKFLVCTSNGSGMTVLNDGQADGTNSITSTADAGGNKSKN